MPRSIGPSPANAVPVGMAAMKNAGYDVRVENAT